MQVLLNGEMRECASDTTLAVLLDETGHADRRVAIEVNQEIVPRSQYRAFALSDGDQIEIVQAIGGG